MVESNSRFEQAATAAGWPPASVRGVSRAVETLMAETRPSKDEAEMVRFHLAQSVYRGTIDWDALRVFIEDAPALVDRLQMALGVEHRSDLRSYARQGDIPANELTFLRIVASVRA